MEGSASPPITISSQSVSGIDIHQPMAPSKKQTSLKPKRPARKSPRQVSVLIDMDALKKKLGKRQLLKLLEYSTSKSNQKKKKKHVSSKKGSKKGRSSGPHKKKVS